MRLNDGRLLTALQIAQNLEDIKLRRNFVRKPELKQFSCDD